MLTTFVVEVYPTLQPDPVTLDTLLLSQILSTITNNASVGDSIISQNQNSFRPVASAIRVNAFWFSSLILSLSTAFVAVLAKQWLYNLSVGLSPIPTAKGRQRQFRHDGVETWKLPSILSTLPIILHLAFLLFFAGLVDFLWSINTIVATTAACLVALTVIFYIGTTFLSFVSLSCPFKCSVMSVSLDFLDGLGREAVATSVTMTVCATGHLLACFLHLYSCFSRVKEISPSAAALLQNFPTEFFKLRKQLNIAWEMLVSPRISWSCRQDRYINAAASTTDAHALAWLVKESPQLHDTNTLADDLCRFPELLVHWLLFIRSGAVKLLDDRLKAVYAGYNKLNQDNERVAFKMLDKDDRAVVLQCTGTLARLLTEWSSDNMDFMYVRINGVQYCWGDPSIIDMRFHLCRPDEAVDDTEDLHFFAIMLRLQFFFSSKDWYRKGISESVDLFFKQLQYPPNTKSIDDNCLKELVNTTAYVASRMIYKEDGDSDWDTWFRYATRALDSLFVLMGNRPYMDFSIYRQICYGIWLISVKVVDSSFPSVQSRIGENALILQVKNIDDLTQALGDVLSQPANWSHKVDILSPIVLMIENLINHASTNPTVSDQDHEDREKLIHGLVSRLPEMLRNLCTKLDSITSAKLESNTSAQLESITNAKLESNKSAMQPIQNFPDILQRIFKICRAVMKDAAIRDQTHAYTDHVEQAFNLLLSITRRLEDVQINDDLSMHKLIWGGVFELTMSWLDNANRKKDDGYRVDLFSGDRSPEEYADAIATLLKAIEAVRNSQVDVLHSSAPDTILTIMAELIHKYNAAEDERVGLVRLRSLLLAPSRDIITRLQQWQHARIWTASAAELESNLVRIEETHVTVQPQCSSQPVEAIAELTVTSLKQPSDVQIIEVSRADCELS